MNCSSEEIGSKPNPVLTCLLTPEEKEKYFSPFRNKKEAQDSQEKSKNPESKEENLEDSQRLKRLSRLYFVMLEEMIEDEGEFLNILKILLKLFGNILEFPEQEKFRKVRMNNQKLKETIGKFTPGLLFLELAGFELDQEQQRVDTFTMETYDIYTLDSKSLSLFSLEILVTLINKKVNETEVAHQKQKKILNLECSQRKVKDLLPESQLLERRKKNMCEKLETPNNKTEERLKKFGELRQEKKTLFNKSAEDQNSNQKGFGGSIRAQLSKFKNWIWTPKSSPTKEELTADPPSPTSTSGLSPCDFFNLGKSAFTLTNDFRQRQKSKPTRDLRWNDGLYEVAMGHCQRMASGEVELGHAGIEHRMEEVMDKGSMDIRAYKENVACVDSEGFLEEKALSKWILEEGSRWKMLAPCTHGAIGVVEADGKYFFTQVLVLL